MKTYLVGGAVRDQLLGRPIKEKDWVIVGATPEELLKQGFKPVGKDFPVFLHPETKEEYALARTERKTAPGYKGFVFNAAPDVTLEDDLRRRDLTINAIAQSDDGKLIDPFGGQQDLKNKIIRHVSPAFAEDPVRILRLARFAARFGDFAIDPETMHLMQTMVANGEVAALVAERVWRELATALSEPYPERFFTVLQECGADKILFPGFSFNNQAISALNNAAKSSIDISMRFAAVFFQLDLNAAKVLCQRYRVPSEASDMLILVIQYLPLYQQALTADAKQLLSLLEKTDAFRRLQRFALFLVTCEACASASNAQQITKHLQKVYEAAANVKVADIMAPGLTGEAIGLALQELRIQAISQINKP